MSFASSQCARSIHVLVRFTLCETNNPSPPGCLTNLWTANGDLLQYKNTKLVDVLEVIQEEHETGIISPAVVATAATAAGGAPTPDQENPMLSLVGASAPEDEGGVEMAATASRGATANHDLSSEI